VISFSPSVAASRRGVYRAAWRSALATSSAISRVRSP
jgi:hypothetical protein